MLDTSARLLALLSLLQSRPRWTGPELAERLGVGVRTVRNDVVRLRELGYTVDAAPGRTGHYTLGIGAVTPPLLLDDEEAVAVTLGLRAGLGLAGLPDEGARALAKLERVLPHRLRRTVAALHDATGFGPANTGSDAEDPRVDPELLARLAASIRDHRTLRFDHGGDPGPARTAELYRLVSWQRRWYVVVRETTASRVRWGVLRVDRLTLRTPDGPVFAPVEAPEDLTELVVREVASTGWSVHARIAVAASADEVLERINPAVGVVEPVDATSSILVTGADSLATVAVWIGMLGLDFRVLDPPGLVEHLKTLAERYGRAVDAGV